MWELYGYWCIQKLSQSAKEGTVASPSLLEGNGLTKCGKIIRGRVGS